MYFVELLKQLPRFSFSLLLIILVNSATATEVKPTPKNRQPMLQMTSLEASKPTERSKIRQLTNHIRKKYRVSKSKVSIISNDSIP